MIAKHYSCYSVTIKALLGMWGVCVYVYMLEYGALALMDLCEYTYACWECTCMWKPKVNFEYLLPNLLLDLEFPKLP